MRPAILRDERDLVWLVIDDVQVDGRAVRYDVHYLARSEPGSAPEPFLSTFGQREPKEAVWSLLDGLGRAVAGEVRALRHDPVNDGLSLEIKARDEGEVRFEIVAWLDLVRMNRAMKARAVRGRHQGGLRFVTDRERLEDFRASLVEALDVPPSGA